MRAPFETPDPDFTVSDREWRDDALCLQTDSEAFFPEKGGTTRDAKRVCAACKVRDLCLQFAIDNNERFGVWGGYSERERKRLGRGEPVPLEQAVERVHGRCGWCRAHFTGERKYCSKTCSSSAARRRKVA